MPKLHTFRDLSRAMRAALVQAALVLPVGVLAGSASALFLWALDAVTRLHYEHAWLLWLLPLAGAGMAWFYQRFGARSEGGNNVILEEIHQPGGGVPARLAPLILVTTLLTHLFGGSAGREGTAVQMGGSLAAGWSRLWRLGAEHTRMLLLAGVAAGFGSVFGTPLAGAVFALEVLALGKLRLGPLFPILVASLAGDVTCRLWGAEHSHYHIAPQVVSGMLPFDPWLLGKVALAAVGFGLVARLFTECVHGLQAGLKRLAPFSPARAAVGGLLVLALHWLVGSPDYLGLGVLPRSEDSITLLSAFHTGGAETFSWLWKLLFTAVTLAAGFRGGEVTPLFFIGATLGNTLAAILGAPTDLLAGLGLIAVFAAAANTPLACILLGVELFGGERLPYFAVACVIAYLCSGHAGIYHAQRLGAGKFPGHQGAPDTPLRDLRAKGQPAAR